MFALTTKFYRGFGETNASYKWNGVINETLKRKRFYKKAKKSGEKGSVHTNATFFRVKGHF